MVFACRQSSRGQFLTGPGLFQTPTPRSVFWIFLCILNDKNGTFTTGHWSANILIALFQQQSARPRSAVVVKMWRFLSLDLCIWRKEAESESLMKATQRGARKPLQNTIFLSKSRRNTWIQGALYLDWLISERPVGEKQLHRKAEEERRNKCLVRCWW